MIALTGAMAPGPFLTVTITETIRKGRGAALMLLVGHAVLEAVLLVGFAFGLQTFLAGPTVAGVLAVVGGAFLLWMGGNLLTRAVRGTIGLHLETAVDVRLAYGPVLQGAAVSLSNPYWTLWWVTIGVKLAADGLAIGPLGVIAFFVGHQLADVAWYGAVILAVSSGKRFLSDKVYRVIIGGCALFLVVLGVLFVRSVFV